MRLFTSILIGLLGVSLALTLLACNSTPQKEPSLLEKVKSRGYLIVGSSYSAPPQAFLDKNGKPNGLDVELVHLIAKELLGDAEKVKLVDLPNPSRLSALNSGQVDVIIGSFSYTKAREKFYDFSKPYMISKFRVLVKKDSGIESIKDFSNKKITFIFGGTSEGILKKTAPSDAILVGFNSLSDEARAFSLNQVDGFAKQEGVLLSYLKKTCGNVMLPDVLDEARYVAGFSKKPSVDSFETEIQRILNQFETDGTINKLKDKWLAIPDYVPCR
jgi:ABC-type amino acid transport substrate-binding protein